MESLPLGSLPLDDLGLLTALRDRGPPNRTRRNDSLAATGTRTQAAPAGNLECLILDCFSACRLRWIPWSKPLDRPAILFPARCLLARALRHRLLPTSVRGARSQPAATRKQLQHWPENAEMQLALACMARDLAGRQRTRHCDQQRTAALLRCCIGDKTPPSILCQPPCGHPEATIGEVPDSASSWRVTRPVLINS